MLDSVGNFLVTAVHHRALDRAAEIAQVRLVTLHLSGLELPHSGHLKPSSVARSRLEAAHEAVVDRGVGTQVADADVVGVIPHGFERSGCPAGTGTRSS